MTTSIKQIDAEARPSSGKGAARAVRRESKVPAVLYGGDHKTAETISLDQNELVKTINRGRFLSTVFDIKVGDKVTRAIPRDVQLDPIKDTPVHVDFQRIGADNRVRIRIPMHFVNELTSPGLKRGGVLNIVRREVEVWAPADNVPDHFEADLGGLDIGRSIHISAIALPEGVSPTIRDRDFTIATIAGAAAARSEADEAAAGGDAAADAKAGAAKAAAPAAAAKGGKK
ncbi:MAG: 50S ribosomal protein L25/general stress protein Ctc [Hyphomicrobiaceae bacterium]